MTVNQTVTDLRFLGDWSVWVGLVAALGVGGAAWALYRREGLRNSGRLSWILPALRGGAVFFIVMMLTGPVLHHTKTIGELARVLVFVDSSKSMSLTDDNMEPGRKLAIVDSLGWLPVNTLNKEVTNVADALALAQRVAVTQSAKTAANPALNDATKDFAKHIQETSVLLGKLRGKDTTALAVGQKNAISREYWQNIGPGNTVADLTSNPNFPDKPTVRGNLDRFEVPTNQGANSGTRMRGYVYPPVTGAYTFWITSDDSGELWLSADDQPSRRQLVARVDGKVNWMHWDQQPSQQSQQIVLTAGHKYYIEALSKQSDGSDFLAVGWQMPDASMERPIPGSRLSAVFPANIEAGDKALDTTLARFNAELLTPSQKLSDSKKDGNLSQAQADLIALGAVAARWEQDLRTSFNDYAARLAASENPAIKSALKKFDALPRWKRVEAELLEGEESLLAKLASKHRVELMSLAGPQTSRIWWLGKSVKLPDTLPGEPNGRSTDLSDGIKGSLDDKGVDRIAVIMFSDGQHNEGSSPLQLAKILGNRGINMFTVGLGSMGYPDDLAVDRVEAPPSVFMEDRVKGIIVLKDDMAPGRPFLLKIDKDGKTLWEKNLVTEHTHLRKIPYDFPIKELVQTEKGKLDADIEMMSMPLDLRVSVTTVDGEKNKDNNESALRLRANMHKPKVLLLDGRPRWEFRYLRNLFARDDQWEVNDLVAGVDAEGTQWKRGTGPHMFPADRESLFAYDLIIFGDVPKEMLKPQELEWIRDFVGIHGGGLIFVDGRRGELAKYDDKAFTSLLPIEYKSNSGDQHPARLQLTEWGAAQAPVSLTGEPDLNAKTWKELPAPHWIAPASALPGAEVMVEAVVGEKKVPALVVRFFGAGKVLYTGFDESWRWRYEVEDKYHQRYWNQIANWIVEPPFTVRDKYVALDAGAVTYRPGEVAQLRVRLRDDKGQPIFKADPQAMLYRDGKKVATIMLEPDEGSGGIFRGKTAPLTEGEYDVRVKVKGFSESDMKAEAKFAVQPSDQGELTALNCNEDLLRQMASQSHGEFFREEQAAQIAKRLEPYSQGKVVESETVLWQSWWWFAPVIGLLTAEWILRKRAGLM